MAVAPALFLALLGVTVAAIGGYWIHPGLCLIVIGVGLFLLGVDLLRVDE